MPRWVDDLGVYALLAAIWIGVPAWIGYKLWSRRKPGRMRAEPVESGLPRTRREPVSEIDAEYGRDYRGPGRKGEPFFAVGGLAFLGWFAFATIVAWWLRGYIQPIADWLAPVGRSLN